MGRVTRAMAAGAAESCEPNNDTVLEVPDENVELLANTKPSTSTSDRTPLEEITPNTNSHDDRSSEQAKEPPKKAKGKKRGKKGGRKKQNSDNSHSDATDSALETDAQSQDDAQTTLPANSNRNQVHPASQGQGSSIILSDMNHSTNTTNSPVGDTPAHNIDDGQDFALVLRSKLAATAPSIAQTPTLIEPTIDDQQATDLMAGVLALDAPASPLPSATPKVVANLKKERGGLRSTSNKENVAPPESPATSRVRTPQPAPTSYDALEAAVIEASTPPVAVRPASPCVTVPQDVASEIESEIERESPIAAPESPTPNAPIQLPAADVDSLPAIDVPAAVEIVAEDACVAPAAKRVKVKKPAPVVRTTKASQARISIARGEMPTSSMRASMGAARASSMFSKSVGLGKSIGQKPVGSNRVASSGSDRSEEEVKNEVIIPHSKPRPVSVSFPAPPKQIKSSKPPTKSTFQLPGEAVAAKLKAAREERLKKETEEPEKKPAFKARPAPAANKKAPLVRPTNSSKFRESIAAGKDAQTVVAALGHKRANSVAATVSSRSLMSSKRAATITAPGLPPVKISSRPSTSLANISKPRASIALDARPGTGKGTTKGKEVFNRPALAKEQAEKEKREKEEAAKKARAEAAERGRQASRDWAEKQKLKMMKDAEAAKTMPAVTVAAVAAV